MSSRKLFNGVISGLLESFISRNSDFRGYWLHGMLLSEGDESRTINLLKPSVSDSDCLNKASEIAFKKFHTLLNSFGLDISMVQSALLNIEVTNETGRIMQGIKGVEGFKIYYSVHVLSDTDINYYGGRVKFVAPHNPRLEQRSARYLPKT